MTIFVFRHSEKDIFVSFTIFVSESAEMCTVFPFSATKIGQFPISAIFGTPSPPRANTDLTWLRSEELIVSCSDMIKHVRVVVT